MDEAKEFKYLESTFWEFDEFENEVSTGFAWDQGLGECYRLPVKKQMSFIWFRLQKYVYERKIRKQKEPFGIRGME